jgi:hypothetical protein
MMQVFLRDSEFELHGSLVVPVSLPELVGDLMQDAIDAALVNRPDYIPDVEAWSFQRLQALGFNLRLGKHLPPEDLPPDDSVF